jgi:pyruvate dehydrogenase E1 component
VAQTLFSSLVQEYVRAHGWGLDQPEGLNRGLQRPLAL